MKCSKCGQPINKNSVFCPCCNKKLKNDSETTKRLILIFIAEIILVVLIALGISSYYNKHFSNQYASQDEFEKFVNDKNYILEDATQSYGGHSVKTYDFATTNDENLGIHYLVADSNSNANKVFNNLYHQIESQRQSGFMNTVSVDLINYNYYSLEDSENYYVIIKTDNTVFAATGISKYKSEINAMVKELGFGYPESVIYIIFSVVLLVSVIIFVTLWKIFVKAGKNGWQSLIPIYNFYCLSKIAFNKGWLFILMLITPINLVFIPITCYKLAKAFGKNNTFAILSIFFPYITMQIIAFDNSKYIVSNDIKTDVQA